MRRMIIEVAVVLALSVTPATGFAQDVGGALDMGQLTGSLAQDHITQSERARAHGQAYRQNRAELSSRNARYCANVPQYRAQYGADNPEFQQLVSMCRRLGYRMR